MKENIINNLKNSRYFSLIITIFMFILMFGASSVYFGFFSIQTFFYLFINNAYLIILGIGMTFVIISGGIDLSVGSLLGLTTMVVSSLITKQNVHPFIVLPLALLMGAAFGTFMGYLIQTFEIAPFIVTLGGLYMARGLCYIVSVDTISITHPFYIFLSEYSINIIGSNFIYIYVLIALIMLFVAMFLAHYTKFGRTVYAIGGNEQSAILMGLPVARTKILIYTFSGFCSALAGIVFTFSLKSGYALHGKGMELDTIAAVVIGGTLLTGGVGYLFGTLFGVLIFGSIQNFIDTLGTLSSWWIRIAIGFLVFVFCLLQRILESSKGTLKEIQPSKEKSEVTAKG